ncbi:hybrid sensor histidine kinase/response regulator [Paenibacillus cymbidii]|uniref:hybrid sensor histidine kinase/response regulator n=1 Tax=Paenibacillus cymbidii TaxID=1639034 RepID=UPI0010813CA8|nr:ATP-binding protein [Paenibacillus cymbidii]
MRRFGFWAGIIVLTAIVAAAMWISAFAGKHAPAAVQGVLDLSGWNFAKDGSVPLDGEWEFYPNRLLAPGDVQGAAAYKRYMTVPGKWEQPQINRGTPMKAAGYGTYRLLIRLQQTDRQFAVAKNYVRFADKLYVEGVLMGQSGLPGESKASYTPRNVPYTAYFHADRNEIELLLQAANFDYRSGGVTNSLYFGLAEDIAAGKTLQTSFEWTASLVSLLFGLFALSLHLWFHRNKLLLLFGAYFFISGLSMITNGERIFMQLFPHLPFEWTFKIKLLATFLRPVALFSIVRVMFKPFAFNKLFLTLAIAYALYCAGIAALPFRIYSLLQDAAYAGVPLSLAVLVALLLIAYARGNYGTLDRRAFQLFFAAVYCLLLTEVSIVLSNENKISGIVTNVAIVLVCLFIVMMQARQYFVAYSSMSRLTRQLQMADRMKDEFLLLTSHELNTPLHGIINLAQSALEEKFKKSGEAKQHERLRLIRSTAYRMSNLVKDVIDAAKLKEGRLDLEPRIVDIVACASVAIEVFGFLAKGRNISFDSDFAPSARLIVADEIRFMQVLYNAIDYALRRVQDGTIAIGSRKVQDGSFVEIAIDPAGVERESTADNGSVAVGLSIASELMERMNGQFALDEAAGTIRLRLPAAAKAAPKEGAKAASKPPVPPGPRTTADRGGPKVLLASADPLNLEQLYGILEMEGYDVSAASSDKEALALVARKERPDIVLLDVLLPEANGYGVCREIRRHFTHAELPVLFISARNTPADIEAGITSGGSDFIARPLDAGEIRVRIRTLLAIKRLAKESARNEMAFLQSQIKPHFLYNALGTIMALCYTDGPRAGELISVFSHYLRVIFHLDNTEETVTLRKEMELVQAYVDIEKARFGERLRFELDADTELYDCRVMPLTIEPLVENAIRHGITKRIQGGTVRLTVRGQTGYVQITVEDDGVGMTPEQAETAFERHDADQGVGLLNIRRRIAHLTDKRPVIESEPGRGTKVTVWLPMERPGTDEGSDKQDESDIN